MKTWIDMKMQRRIEDTEIVIHNKHIKQSNHDGNKSNSPSTNISAKITSNTRNQRTIPHLIINSNIRIKSMIDFTIFVVSKYKNLNGSNITSNKRVIIIQPTESKSKTRNIIICKNLKRQNEK